jgi:hypothetical protein
MAHGSAWTVAGRAAISMRMRFPFFSHTIVLLFVVACGSSATGSSGGSPSSSGGGGGTVSIKNFVYAPDPTSTDHFEFTFTFGLDNGGAAAIETITTLALDVGDAHVEGHMEEGDQQCTDKSGTAWKVPAGGHSGTIDGFYLNGCGIDHVCLSARYENCHFATPEPVVAFSGPITLTLKGTLADSTPFTATATGSKQ